MKRIPRTLASAPTHPKQREGRHLRPEFRGRSTRRHHDAPETARRSPLTSKTSRTLHAPASRRAGNSEKVATYVQNFEDAPRASVTTRRKQREGRHLRPELRGRSTRQRHDAPETARRSPLTPRISMTLHAPASRRFADALGTLCGHFATSPRHLLDPWTPTLKREPFCGAFGKNKRERQREEKNKNNVQVKR